MKISKRTLDVLKNFSNINPSLLIKAEDKSLKVFSNGGEIVGQVDIEETIPYQAAIYDMHMFLAIVGKDDVDYDFGEQQVTLKHGNSKSVIRYVDPSLIKYIEKKLNFPGAEVTFDLDYGALESVMSKATILKLPNILVTVEEGKLVLKATDKKSESGHNASLVLGQIEGNKEFKYFFNAENFKLLPESYTVELHSRGISRFTTKTKDSNLTYYIALEKEGTIFKDA